MLYAASIGDELTNLFGDVITVVVKIAIFIVIMVIGWFVARWVYTWADRLLTHMGLDRAVDRGGLRRIMGDWRASDLAAKVIQYALLLLILQLALGVFGPNPVSDLIHGIVAWLPRLFVAIVIVAVAAAIAGAVKEVIGRALHGLSYGRMLGTIAQVFILALGVIAALGQVGIASSVTEPVLIAALATLAGILIVGVGGGMIKPMQARWERMLTRAEAETSTAAERVRTNREERDRNAPTQFGQPAYGGQRAYGTAPVPPPTIPSAYGGAPPSGPPQTAAPPPGGPPSAPDPGQPRGEV